MVFHLAIFFWSIAFYMGLWVVSYSPIFHSWGWYLISVVPLIILSLIASQKLTKHYSDAAIPILLSLASPTLLSLIDHPGQQKVFMVLSALMYYYALLGNYRLRHAPTDKTAEAFLNAAAMAGIFFFYTSLYGFYLNFNFPLWGLMLLFFLGTAFTSYETFVSLDQQKNQRRMFLYSSLLGLIMGEMVWVLSFWPFGYLTTGSLALIFFFLLWDVAFDAFRNTLSLKKAVLRIFFFFLLGLALLLTSPWRILV